MQIFSVGTYNGRNYFEFTGPDSVLYTIYWDSVNGQWVVSDGGTGGPKEISLAEDVDCPISDFWVLALGTIFENFSTAYCIVCGKENRYKETFQAVRLPEQFNPQNRGYKDCCCEQLIQKTNKPFLIVCPLGVSGEFKRDNKKLNTGYDVTYITDTDNFENANIQIYLTNYERVRKGDINPELFCGVSFDEASILRNLQTETTQYVLSYFRKVAYRFVATATPTMLEWVNNHADVGMKGWHRVAHAVLQHLEQEK